MTMPTTHLHRSARRLPASLRAIAMGCMLALPVLASAQTPAVLQAKVAEQVTPLLDSLKDLVALESGSRDLEGLARIADFIGARLQAAGMQVQQLPAKAPDFHPQLKGAKLGPMVYAKRTGTGTKKVLLIAHMDTVYPRGMGAKQPFRVDGDRAYGLGIADDKQGVALILHTVDLLARRGFADYAQLGVLINSDEEIGSPGSGAFSEWNWRGSETASADRRRAAPPPTQPGSAPSAASSH